MNRTLLQTPSFARDMKRFLKRHSDLKEVLRATLDLLSADAFDPLLKTHKLAGTLANSWACSAGYDLRIIFEFVPRQDTDAIRLLALGTHDELY